MPQGNQRDSFLQGKQNNQTKYYREFLGILAGQQVDPSGLGEAVQALCEQTPIFWVRRAGGKLHSASGPCSGIAALPALTHSLQRAVLLAGRGSAPLPRAAQHELPPDAVGLLLATFVFTRSSLRSSPSGLTPALMRVVIPSGVLFLWLPGGLAAGLQASLTSFLSSLIWQVRGSSG